MPLFREYEYTRLSLHAIFYTASRQEVKIVEFYSSRGALRLPRAIKKAFRLGPLSLKEFEKSSVRTWRRNSVRVRDKPDPQEAKAPFEFIDLSLTQHLAREIQC